MPKGTLSKSVQDRLLNKRRVSYKNARNKLNKFFEENIEKKNNTTGDIIDYRNT